MHHAAVQANSEDKGVGLVGAAQHIVNPPPSDCGSEDHQESVVVKGARRNCWMVHSQLNILKNIFSTFLQTYIIDGFLF